LIEGKVDVNIAVAGVTPLMTCCVIPQQSNNKGKYQLIKLLLTYGMNNYTYAHNEELCDQCRLWNLNLNHMSVEV
jgi:hypothetical protein